eukprot:5715556-Amphidinium_carterae.1
MLVHGGFWLRRISDATLYCACTETVGKYQSRTLLLAKLLWEQCFLPALRFLAMQQHALEVLASSANSRRARAL